ncbi:hypothetical protein JKP88DRAFT_243581 [Tribonema minus]|uniref:Uncharacterized protein n=1 Tax=Tribonema minus TaxID=303371 RepID=A0A836CKC2_9STRA|nr:hypothetical protein JKP88DRAFT_243581 [Tribonema minus]
MSLGRQLVWLKGVEFSSSEPDVWWPALMYASPNEARIHHVMIMMQHAERIAPDAPVVLPLHDHELVTSLRSDAHVRNYAASFAELSGKQKMDRDMHKMFDAALVLATELQRAAAALAAPAPLQQQQQQLAPVGDAGAGGSSGETAAADAVAAAASGDVGPRVGVAANKSMRRRKDGSSAAPAAAAAAQFKSPVLYATAAPVAREEGQWTGACDWRKFDIFACTVQQIQFLLRHAGFSWAAGKPFIRPGVRDAKSRYARAGYRLDEHFFLDEDALMAWLREDDKWQSGAWREEVTLPDGHDDQALSTGASAVPPVQRSPAAAAAAAAAAAVAAAAAASEAAAAAAEVHDADEADVEADGWVGEHSWRDVDPTACASADVDHLSAHKLRRGAGKRKPAAGAGSGGTAAAAAVVGSKRKYRRAASSAAAAAPPAAERKRKSPAQSADAGSSADSDAASPAAATAAGPPERFAALWQDLKAHGWFTKYASATKLGNSIYYCRPGLPNWQQKGVTFPDEHHTLNIHYFDSEEQVLVFARENWDSGAWQHPVGTALGDCALEAPVPAIRGKRQNLGVRNLGTVFTDPTLPDRPHAAASGAKAAKATAGAKRKRAAATAGAGAQASAADAPVPRCRSPYELQLLPAVPPTAAVAARDHSDKRPCELQLLPEVPPTAAAAARDRSSKRPAIAAAPAAAAAAAAAPRDIEVFPSVERLLSEGNNAVWERLHALRWRGANPDDGEYVLIRPGADPDGRGPRRRNTFTMDEATAFLRSRPELVADEYEFVDAIQRRGWKQNTRGVLSTPVVAAAGGCSSGARRFGSWRNAQAHVNAYTALVAGWEEQWEVLAQRGWRQGKRGGYETSGGQAYASQAAVYAALCRDAPYLLGNAPAAAADAGDACDGGSGGGGAVGGSVMVERGYRSDANDDDYETDHSEEDVHEFSLAEHLFRRSQLRTYAAHGGDSDATETDSSNEEEGSGSGGEWRNEGEEEYGGAYSDAADDDERSGQEWGSEREEGYGGMYSDAADDERSGRGSGSEGEGWSEGGEGDGGAYSDAVGAESSGDDERSGRGSGTRGDSGDDERSGSSSGSGGEVWSEGEQGGGGADSDAAEAESSGYDERSGSGRGGESGSTGEEGDGGADSKGECNGIDMRTAIKTFSRDYDDEDDDGDSVDGGDPFAMEDDDAAFDAVGAAAEDSAVAMSSAAVALLPTPDAAALAAALSDAGASMAVSSARSTCAQASHSEPPPWCCIAAAAAGDAPLPAAPWTNKDMSDLGSSGSSSVGDDAESGAAVGGAVVGGAAVGGASSSSSAPTSLAAVARSPLAAAAVARSMMSVQQQEAGALPPSDGDAHFAAAGPVSAAAPPSPSDAQVDSANRDDRDLAGDGMDAGITTADGATDDAVLTALMERGWRWVVTSHAYFLGVPGVPAAKRTLGINAFLEKRHVGACARALLRGEAPPPLPQAQELEKELRRRSSSGDSGSAERSALQDLQQLRKRIAPQSAVKRRGKRRALKQVLSRHDEYAPSSSMLRRLCPAAMLRRVSAAVAALNHQNCPEAVPQRAQQLAVLTRNVTDALAERCCPAVYVCGAPGTGKTCALQQLDTEIIFTTVTHLSSLELPRAARTVAHRLQLARRHAPVLRPSAAAPCRAHPLVRLCLCDNALTSMDALLQPAAAALLALRDLFQHCNRTARIPGLAACPRLQRLWHFGNRIARLKGLHHCGDVRELWVHDNAITRLSMCCPCCRASPSWEPCSLMLTTSTSATVRRRRTPLALYVLPALARLDGTTVAKSEAMAVRDAHLCTLLQFGNQWRFAAAIDKRVRRVRRTMQR